MFIVDVAGGQVAGEVSGTGPPLVLLHAGVADRRMWNAVVPLLEPDFTVARFDLRGFGGSSASVEPYRDVDDLIAVLDHCGIGTAHLVGASQGGAVALDAALAQPDRVASLILLAPGLPGRPEWSPQMRAYFTAEEAAAEAGDIDEVIRLNLDVWVRGPERDWSPQALAIAADLRPQLQILITNQVRAEDLSEFAEPALRDNLHRIGVPTVVGIAEADPTDLVDTGEYIAARIPGARTVRYPGTGHLIALERPVETVALITEAVNAVRRV